MAHKLTVELTNEQYDTLVERAERRGLDVEDDAALADDLVTVWWGRLRALEKHNGKIAAVRADPIKAALDGITFEPRKPFLAPDALDVARLVGLGVAPEPKAHTMAEAHAAHAKAKEAPKAAKAPKAKASKAKAAQTTLPLPEPKAKGAQA